MKSWDALAAARYATASSIKPEDREVSGMSACDASLLTLRPEVEAPGLHIGAGEVSSLASNVLYVK
ncbi:hypothetical protein EYF80_045769 [Liparis tanakae]|uniref:Uncharacterized protein n=1 Tax=Liparis tanakae TaxID=230148 RepID=A0A4Z2FT54_9TELE|nr:hypothetical protein EYF80_045769 [Liparis tanakae]